MTFPLIYNSFTGGQIVTDGLVGRTLEGRSDIQLYATSLRRCSNWIPLTGGALFKRPGLKRIARLDDLVVVRPFIFNESQVYLFAFRSSGLLNVYRNDVLVAADISIPWTASQLPHVKFTQSLDTWIGFHGDVVTTSIKRGANDSIWNVSTISWANQWTKDFGAGAEAVFSATRGYPRCGAFHQNRLIVAGTTFLPQTIWGSVVGSFFDMNHGTTDDDMSFEFTLAANEVNTVQDIFSVAKRLIINTSYREWTETSTPITPTKVQFNMETRHGMLDTGIRSVGVDSASLFVDRQSQLRVFSYDFSSDSFVAQKVTTLAPGILKTPTDAAFCRGFLESNLIFFRNSNGSITTLTLDMEQKVRAFSTFDVGEGSILSICGLDENLYAVMEFNGKRFVTKFTTDHYIDLWTSASSGSPTTNWNAFTDFAGKTVTVIGDGVIFPSVAVDGSGNFVLPNPVSSIVIGVKYISLAETLPLMPTVGEPTKGKRVRKVNAVLQLRATKDIWVNGRRIELRKFGDHLLDQPVEQIDRMKGRVALSGSATETTVIIESRDPLPALLLSLVVNFRAPGPRP